MTKTFEELLLFCNTGEASGAAQRAAEVLGETNLRVILAKLFSWLQWQHRFKHEKPLELKSEFTWCQDLPRFIEADDALRKTFALRGLMLTFDESVSLDDRSKLRELVAKAYRPVLRT